MDEMLEETMEGMDDEEELESEANEEVEKILFEITDGKLGVQNSKVGALPVRPRSFRLPRSVRLTLLSGCRSRPNQQRKICKRTKRWRGLLLDY